MEELYQKIEEYVIKTGKRLVSKSGIIKDIGITKVNVTEEDFRIEQELVVLITKDYPDHKFYAEELHHKPVEAENIWVVDPISGTNLFINGEPHYAIVIAHIYQNEVQYALVYDRSANELFTAHKGKGALLNGNLIEVSTPIDLSTLQLLFMLSEKHQRKQPPEQIYDKLKPYNPYKLRASFALQYCYVACGRYDGFIAMTKDAFSEFAGSLIVQEAKGKFTNSKHQQHLSNTDRIFIGGNKLAYETIEILIKEVLKKA